MYRYFSQVNKYTLSYRFYMEMSKGVSLLRTAQSLLTGRTIVLMLWNIYEAVDGPCSFRVVMCIALRPF